MSAADTPRGSASLRTLDGVKNVNLNRWDVDVHDDAVVGSVEGEREERAALGLSTGQIASSGFNVRG